MKLFRKYSIDSLLKSALNENKVLCGLSAGAIVLCHSGCSNSLKYKLNPNKACNDNKI